MPVVGGFVIAEQDVEGVRMPGDTAEVRTTYSGRAEMEVLGVFHPSEDPATRA
jgi:hypothetical protein